jgi:hypothetical protein
MLSRGPCGYCMHYHQVDGYCHMVGCDCLLEDVPLPTAPPRQPRSHAGLGLWLCGAVLLGLLFWSPDPQAAIVIVSIWTALCMAAAAFGGLFGLRSGQAISVAGVSFVLGLLFGGRRD